MRKPIQINTPDSKQYVSIKEAARIYDCESQTIRNYLYEEKLQPYKFMTFTLINVKELIKLKKGN